MFFKYCLQRQLFEWNEYYFWVLSFFPYFYWTFQNCRQFVFQAPFRAKRGGGGAPLRSSTGQIITKFCEDPTISFSDSARKHVENHLRYKTSNEHKKQYKMELDRCRAERMRRDAKNSLDMVWWMPEKKDILLMVLTVCFLFFFWL